MWLQKEKNIHRMATPGAHFPHDACRASLSVILSYGFFTPHTNNQEVCPLACVRWENGVTLPFAIFLTQ